MASCAAVRGTAADILSRIYLKCRFRSFRHIACRRMKVSCANRQHVPIGGEMPLSREFDGVAMSAVTATGMPRIRKNTAASGAQPGEDTYYLMSAVDAWFIGTEFAEAPGTMTARGDADLRNTLAWNRRDGSIRAATRRFLGCVQSRQRAEELRRAWTRCVKGPWPPRPCERTQCVTQQVRGLAVPGREPEAPCSRRAADPWRPEHCNFPFRGHGSVPRRWASTDLADTDWPSEASEGHEPIEPGAQGFQAGGRAHPDG